MFTSIIELPLFKDIDVQDQSFLLSRFTERSYPSKQIVFFQGDEAHEMYIIKSGALRIYRENDGKQIILGHQFPGETIGELEVLHHDNHRLASVATIENTTMWVIKKPHLEEIINVYPQVMRRLFYVVSERLHQADRKIDYLAFLDARVRVANLLLDLYSNFGVPTAEGHLINWRITHHNFADMIGIGRESATRILHEFQQSAIIKLLNKRILIVDLPALKTLSGEHHNNSESRHWHSFHKYNINI